MGTPDSRNRARSRSTVRRPTPSRSASTAARHRVRTRPEQLDQPLLPLHPPQRQVVVPRVGGPAYRRRWFHSAEITATGVAELISSVQDMTSTNHANETIEDFFARYTGYLTDGDLDGLADIYHYPALAVSPAGCLAITDPEQTRAFFAQGREFYHARQIMAVRAREIVTDVEVGRSGSAAWCWRTWTATASWWIASATPTRW